MAEIKYLSLERLSYYDAKLKAFLAAADEATLKAAQDYADGLADNYDAAGTAASLVKALEDGKVKANADAIAALQTAMGDLENLNTTDKDSLVDAINEVRNSVSAGGTAAAITLTTDTTTEGMLKSYTLKQGDNLVGVIDIPKELMAVRGVVVKDPEGQAAGTYIELTIQNGDPVYINVASLIDNYTAAAGAAQVQVAIDADTREISATLVAGGVGTTELADLAVTTAKIADGNVTKAKLSTTVQASLDKADSAMQQSNLNSLKTDLEAYADQAEADAVATAAADATTKADAALATANTNIATAKSEAISTAASDATTKVNAALADAKKYTDDEIAKIETGVQEVKAGSVNGTIAVDGTDVAVTGLGSAAYTSADAYDVAGAASSAQTAAQSYTDTKIAAVNDTISKIDTGVMSVTTGTANGAIHVDGEDVAVKGLGSAAYTEASAYDASGAAAQALVDAKTHVATEIAKINTGVMSVTEGTANGTISVDGKDVAVHGLGSAAYAATTAFDAAGSAADVQTNLTNYQTSNDAAVKALQSADTSLGNRVTALEEVTHVAITEAEIDGLFNK